MEGDKGHEELCSVAKLNRRFSSLHEYECFDVHFLEHSYRTV
jgi:hypothetical protein